MLKERLYYFIVSLFFGLLAVYLINTPPVVIVRYPNIDQISNVIFIDESVNDLCYELKPESVDC